MPEIFFLILVTVFSCFITVNDNKIVLAVFLYHLERFSVLQRHYCNEANTVFFGPTLGTTIAGASHLSYF